MYPCSMRVLSIQKMRLCIYIFAAFKYDAEKSAKEKKERKEKQLKRIEEARKRASERKGKALSTRY